MKLVLIVEDEYGNAEVLQMLLEAEGYRVAAAANGKAALELLTGEKPAAILSDFMMPHMTGSELGLAVRANPALDDIPFVFVSASDESIVQELFKDYDAFVKKPIEAESLLQLVAHFVAHGRPAEQDKRDPEVDRSMRLLLRGVKLPPG
jgi:two-component system, OmpR family, phosphate regulon response regulator PhoB